jgi:hypothetical protein
MNDITERKSGSVAASTDNYFAAYGEQVSQKSIVGQLLKFSKGDYLVGEDNDEVPLGTRYIVNMDELLVGWIRWSENRPTDQVMGKVSDGYQPPRRNELGDNDKAQWETDTDGRERDPWQFSNYVLFKGDGDGELYTFTTSSRGGLNAIGDLCKSYGKAVRQRPDQYPVVAIGSGSYQHPNRDYGRIKYPTFEIVNWVSKDVFAEDVAADEAGTVPSEQPAPAPAPKPKAKARF